MHLDLQPRHSEVQRTFGLLIPNLIGLFCGFSFSLSASHQMRSFAGYKVHVRENKNSILLSNCQYNNNKDIVLLSIYV